MVHVPFSPELFSPLCNLAHTPALSVGVDERGLGVRRGGTPQSINVVNRIKRRRFQSLSSGGLHANLRTAGWLDRQTCCMLSSCALKALSSSTTCVGLSSKWMRFELPS